MAYYIIILGSIILIFLLMFSNGKVTFSVNKNKYILGLLFLCWILSAFRSTSVGTDTANYARLYNIICRSSWADILSSFKYQGTEIGYNVLSKIFSYISKDYYAFQVLICAIFCFGFYPFIKNNSKNPVLALAVFYGSGLYLYSFNISRQMLAVMLVANAWDYLKEKNYKVFVLLVFSAILFHSTAVIFLLIFIGYFGWKNRTIRKVILALTVLCWIFYLRLFEELKILLRGYYNYSSYLENNRDVQTAGMVVYFWAIIVVMSFLYIYYCRRNNSQFGIIGFFALLFVICNLIGLNINYFYRIGYYFMPFLIPLFDEVYFLFKKGPWAKVYMLGAIICLNIYYIISISYVQYKYSSFLF